MVRPPVDPDLWPRIGDLFTLTKRDRIFLVLDFKLMESQGNCWLTFYSLTSGRRKHHLLDTQTVLGGINIISRLGQDDK